MPSSRVVRVRSVRDGVAAAALRDGIAQIQADLEVTAEFPPEVHAEVAAARTIVSLDGPGVGRTAAAAFPEAAFEEAFTEEDEETRLVGACVCCCDGLRWGSIELLLVRREGAEAVVRVGGLKTIQPSSSRSERSGEARSRSSSAEVAISLSRSLSLSLS